MKDSSLQQAEQKRAQMVGEMRCALASQQFQLHFQPILDLASGKIVKAEESHLIGPIGDWVFREAAQWARRWRCTRHPNFQISINKSPAQFGHTPEHACNWIAHLDALGLAGQAIAVEITEGLLLHPTPEIRQCLHSYPHEWPAGNSPLWTAENKKAP